MAPAPRILHHGDGVGPGVALIHHAVAQKAAVVATLVKRGTLLTGDIVGLSIYGAFLLFPLALCIFQIYRYHRRSKSQTLRFVHTDHELDLVSPTPDEEAPPRHPGAAVVRNDRYIPNSLPEIVSFVRNDPRPPPPYRSRPSSRDHLLPHAVQ